MNAIETDTGVLVIGIGNPLRGDDAVGWFAAQWLAERADASRVATMAVHLLTPEWAEPLSRCRLVLFVDAAEGPRPGMIDIRQIEPADAAGSLAHQLSPERLLALTRRLYGKSPHAYLCTVGGGDFGHKEELSEVVEKACKDLVRRIQLLIRAESATA